MDAYETCAGATAEQCAAERQLLAEGHIYAVAFTSTAEVLTAHNQDVCNCSWVPQIKSLSCSDHPTKAAGTTVHQGFVACGEKLWGIRSSYGVMLPQAEGLLQIMGGKEALQQMLGKWGTILAAHGPYTAAGAFHFIFCILRLIPKTPMWPHWLWPAHIRTEDQKLAPNS